MCLTDIVFSWEERDEKYMNRAIGWDCECQGGNRTVTGDVGDPWLQVEQGQKTFFGIGIWEGPKESCKDLCFKQMTLAVWRKGTPPPPSQGAKSLKQLANKDLGFLGHTLIGPCHIPPALSDWHFRVVSLLLLMCLSSEHVSKLKRAMYE